MTNITTTIAADVPTLTDDRAFAAGTVIVDFTAFADNASEAKESVLAEQRKHLRNESVTLADGTVVETTHGVDFSLRVSNDRRDRDVAE